MKHLKDTRRVEERPCRHEFKKGTFFIGKDLYKMLDCVKCGVTFKKKI